MRGEKFSRSFVNMQESVLGMLSFPRSTARLPHVTLQPLATNEERSEMENADRAAFARLRSFLVTARRGIGYVDFFLLFFEWHVSVCILVP
jgi:hypothetical protein